ncbi:hypothetical protein [Melghirimyces algeriensis]|uniref:hypothetical protein n=1 Tax=Melghirimyces algeriensis TaxID=910412 RepID=UPI001159C1F3|nr:hypothetical protein [Melghirimyces algeriensis]
MKHPFPTTQRNPWRFQPFSGQPAFPFCPLVGTGGGEADSFHFLAGGKRCGNGYLPFTTLS